MVAVSTPARRTRKSNARRRATSATPCLIAAANPCAREAHPLLGPFRRGTHASPAAHHWAAGVRLVRPSGTRPLPAYALTFAAPESCLTLLRFPHIVARVERIRVGRRGARMRAGAVA